MELILPAHTRLEAMKAADFGTVAQLGETIWRSHYANMVSNAQIDYMLANRYTPEKLQLYLEVNDHWLSLLRISDRAVGYCSYALTGRPGEMKVEQLYLLSELHHKGLGKAMLNHIEKQAQARGLDTLVLQVNKQNAAAILFYRKAGFSVREEAKFDIGNGFVMDDYVMEKSLPSIKT